MNPLSRLLQFSVLALALAGCASAGSEAGQTRSAYDKACRSIYMSKAAAREASWCWHAVGARSYEEWAALEQPEALDRPAVATARAEIVVR